MRIAAGLALLAPPLQEATEGFLGISWWIWILIGVGFLLLLLIVGLILQNEPGPPIPKRESRMYITPARPPVEAPEPSPAPAPEKSVPAEPAEEPQPEPAAEKSVQAEPVEELQPEPAAAEAAQAEPAVSDDLLKIEGIGPKVAGLLNEAGITTFAALAETSVDRLNEILDEEDLEFMNPESWPKQASLAAKGDWEAFENLTESLKGGRQVT
jgi:predicted flap endonuclease-1-like 5' DNA nuclease